MNCPHCNAKVGITLNGHLETTICPDCGWEQYATIIPGEDICFSQNPAHLVTVQIHWDQSRSCNQQIVRAHQIFSSLQEIPLPMLLQAAKLSNVYSLGVYYSSVAIDMQEKAKQHGLKVTFTEIVE